MVKNIIKKRKFIGDIPEDEMKLIEKACKLEKRSRISFVRKASVDYAKKILENQNANTTNSK